METKKNTSNYKRLSKDFRSKQRETFDNSSLEELVPFNFSDEVLSGKRKIKVREVKKKNV